MPRFSLRFLLILVAMVGLLLTVAMQVHRGAFSVIHTPEGRNMCSSRMAQLSLALMNYHDVCGRFPPACTYDKNGKPLNSWRVLILPFLEYNNVAMRYDHKQPWNSSHNWKLIQEVDWGIFRCPSSQGDPQETNYVVVVGDETAWPPGKQLSARRITDGVSQTIMLVEVADSGIHWAEPRDLPLSQALLGVNPPHVKLSISSRHRGGANVSFCDASRHFLPNDTRIELLRALLTRAGGRSWNLPRTAACQR
jgi:prepilin-type processing-associated H-X9-DG protein